MRIVAGMLAVLVAGCNSSGEKADAGAMDLGAVADLSGGGGSDLALPPQMLTGTNLVPGAGFIVVGVTGDNLVIYADAKGALFAVPIAGGKPTQADSGAGLVRVRGNVVFSWSGYDQMSNLGALTIYSSASGAVPLANGSIGRAGAVSTDGKYIAWTGNVDPSGTTASVFVGKPDGSVKMEVLKGRSTDPGCVPTMAWWKDVFVVATCGDAGDAGVAPATVDLIDPQSFAVTEVVNNAMPFFSIDDAGSKLFAIDMAGNGIVKQRGQTSSTIVDSAVSDGFITHDGSAVVYLTSGGALKRWTQAAKTTLVAANATGFTGISNSQAFLTFFNQFDQQTTLNDVYLASSTAENQTATPLVSTATGAVYGDPFTVDEKFALYFSTVDPNDFSGTLDAWGTAAGGLERELGQRVWIVGAVSGSRVLYNDNFVATKSSGYADLKLLDLAGTSAPTVIATRADPDFFTTTARDKVVFTVNQQKGKEGVYVAPLP